MGEKSLDPVSIFPFSLFHFSLLKKKKVPITWITFRALLQLLEIVKLVSGDRTVEIIAAGNDWR